MNRNNILYSLLGVGLFVACLSCSGSLAPNEFRVRGTLAGIDKNHLLLLTRIQNEEILVDTIPHQNSSFEAILTTSDSLPAMAYLAVVDTTFQQPEGEEALIKKPWLDFFVSPRAEIEILGTVEHFTIATVKGGGTTMIYRH